MERDFKYEEHSTNIPTVCENPIEDYHALYVNEGRKTVKHYHSDLLVDCSTLFRYRDVSRFLVIFRGSGSYLYPVTAMKKEQKEVIITTLCYYGKSKDEKAHFYLLDTSRHTYRELTPEEAVKIAQEEIEEVDI